MTTLSNDKLAELEALAKAATPGKRYIERTADCSELGTRRAVAANLPDGSRKAIYITENYEHPSREDEALALATDPQTVLELVEEVRRLRSLSDMCMAHHGKLSLSEGCCLDRGECLGHEND